MFRTQTCEYVSRRFAVIKGQGGRAVSPHRVREGGKLIGQGAPEACPLVKFKGRTSNPQPQQTRAQNHDSQFALNRWTLKRMHLNLFSACQSQFSPEPTA